MHGLTPNGDWEGVRIDEIGRILVSTSGESTAMEYILDDPSASGERGPLSVGIRHDAETSPVSSDGDYHPLTFNSVGRLKVSTMPGIYDAVTGNLTTATQTLPIDVTRASNIVIHVKNTGGTNMVAGQFAFEGSLDSSDGTDGTWFAIQVVRSNANTIETTSGTLTINAGAGLAYSWEASVNAYNWVRVRCTTNATASSIPAWRLQRGSYATEPIPAAQAHAVTLSSTTANIGTVAALAYTDTAANLGSAATFTGTSRDASATVAYQKFVANAVADQDGTLYIQKSTDNVTWRNAGMVAVTANTPKELEVGVTTRYNRVYYVNGAGVQTQFLLTSALQRI